LHQIEKDEIIKRLTALYNTINPRSLSDDELIKLYVDKSVLHEEILDKMESAVSNLTENEARETARLKGSEFQELSELPDIEKNKPVWFHKDTLISIIKDTTETIKDILISEFVE